MNFARQILYEDNHLILLYKPAGIPVQGDSSGDRSLLDYGKEYLIRHYQKSGNAYLSLPHRLDRPVAGLCVLAKTTKAMQRLSQAFQQQKTQKYYLAVVHGHPPAPHFSWQRLQHYLQKNESQNRSHVVEPFARHTSSQEKSRVKLASLEYCVLNTAAHYSILAVHLGSGRHHQIRCQLAAVGHPILDDLKYGASSGSHTGNHEKHYAGIQLFAFALEIPLVTPRQEDTSAGCSSRKPYFRSLAAPPSLAPTLGNDSKNYASIIQKNQRKNQHWLLRSLCFPWEHPAHLPQHPPPIIWSLCDSEVLQFCTQIFHKE